MKKRTETQDIKHSTLVAGTGFEIAITMDGREVGRYERYSYGKLSGNWSDWDTLPRALSRLTMSRGQAVRQAIARAYSQGYVEGFTEAGGIVLGSVQ